MLLSSEFTPESSVRIDLLAPDTEERFLKQPSELLAVLQRLITSPVEFILIDEIQRVPALLNIVHQQIEIGRFKFGLTGSSARKLKRGQANLLAGRAFTYRLYPFTHRELGDRFDLEEAISWGTLPKASLLATPEEKRAYLRSYTETFLKEEIIAEQLVRSLAPFRRFLDIAAQMNAELVNYSAIARDVGADPNTVKGYFEILEDTLIGTLLPPFHESIRKRQRHAPKFYLFDPGIVRTMDKTLTILPQPSSFAYGKLFEQFVVLEMMRLNDYYGKDFSFSFLRTKDDLEVDLVVERPGRPTAFLEIKATNRINEQHVGALNRLLREFDAFEGYCLSRDPTAKKFGKIDCLEWREGIRELGL